MILGILFLEILVNDAVTSTIQIQQTAVDYRASHNTMQELTSYLLYALVFSLEITKDKYEYILYCIPDISTNTLLPFFPPSLALFLPSASPDTFAHVSGE